MRTASTIGITRSVKAKEEILVSLELLADAKTLDDEAIRAISDDMFKASKPVRATLLPPGYRTLMVRVMTARAMREIGGGEIP